MDDQPLACPVCGSNEVSVDYTEPLPDEGEELYAARCDRCQAELEILAGAVVGIGEPLRLRGSGPAE